MHLFTHAALILLLPLLTQPAHAQAPLPPGFVDAAAVVDGLVVDMRYFGDNNFVGERIDGYERPRCILSAPAANALADVQRELAARRTWLESFRLLPTAARGRKFRSLGAAHRRCEA
jgi:D-alanyl-D-alanine dipeptidase